jgi:hypothetical protein
MMQIYLPFPNIETNLGIMTESDLGHQRNCALTILESLSGKAKGWMWHPGVTMWAGNADLLAHIAVGINHKWCEAINGEPYTTEAGIRGLSKTYIGQLTALGFKNNVLYVEPKVKPWWWGHDRFHKGNQATLVRHDRGWYGQLFKVDSGLCEWWPQPNEDQWVYGPQMGPDGDYAQYHLYDKPILDPVRRMSDDAFAHHANVFHNLMGKDWNRPISPKDTTLSTLRLLHDRFHQKRVYTTHDHR